MGTITSANALRGYFETGDRPTSAQFSDLIESFVHRVSAAGTSQIVSGFGGGAVGTEIFNANTTASAQGHIGAGTVGITIVEAGTTASAQSVQGGGTVGRTVFEAITTASAHTVQGAGAVGREVYSAIATASALGHIAADRESIGGTIVSPVNSQRYILDQFAPFAYNIEWIAAKTSVGDARIQLQIDGADVSGISNNENVDASATEIIASAAAANAVAVGNTVSVVVTALSAADYIGFTVGLKRT